MSLEVMGFNEEITASILRQQINLLDALQKDIENRSFNVDFADENLEKVEKNIRLLRKMIQTNH